MSYPIGSNQAHNNSGSNLSRPSSVNKTHSTEDLSGIKNVADPVLSNKCEMSEKTTPSTTITAPVKIIIVKRKAINTNSAIIKPEHKNNSYKSKEFRDEGYSDCDEQIHEIKKFSSKKFTSYVKNKSNDEVVHSESEEKNTRGDSTDSGSLKLIIEDENCDNSESLSSKSPIGDGDDYDYSEIILEIQKQLNGIDFSNISYSFKYESDKYPRQFRIIHNPGNRVTFTYRNIPNMPKINTSIALACEKNVPDKFIELISNQFNIKAKSKEEKLARDENFVMRMKSIFDLCAPENLNLSVSK